MYVTGCARKLPNARNTRRRTLGERDVKVEQGAEHFDRGFSLLMEGEMKALPFLARAVHFAPKETLVITPITAKLFRRRNSAAQSESELQAALRSIRTIRHSHFFWLNSHSK